MAVHHGSPSAATAATRPKTPSQHACLANLLPTFRQALLPTGLWHECCWCQTPRMSLARCHMVSRYCLSSLSIRQFQLHLGFSETSTLDLGPRTCLQVALWVSWLVDDGHGSGESSQKHSTVRLNCDFITSGTLFSKHLYQRMRNYKEKSSLKSCHNQQGLRIRNFPAFSQYWSVFLPSTSRMSGGDVQTDAQATPGRFLDMPTKRTSTPNMLTVNEDASDTPWTAGILYLLVEVEDSEAPVLIYPFLIKDLSQTAH